MKRFFHRKYFNKRKENKDKNHVDGIDWIVTIVFQEFLIDIEQKKEKEREKSKTTLCLIDTLRNKKRVKSFRDFFFSLFLSNTYDVYFNNQLSSRILYTWWYKYSSYDIIE